MGSHVAEVEWRSDGGFADNRYSRRHVWRFDGGAEVTASASPAVVPEPMSDPTGVDPEEALVAAAASCHMLWFLSLAQAAGLEVEAYADRAEGLMGRVGPGRIGMIRIVLRPAIDYRGRAPDAAEAARLHEQAHEKCFIANSLTTEIVVEGA